MGLPNEVNSALIGAAAAGGYTIDQSIRFIHNDSHYFSRSSGSSAATNGKIFTTSVWIKYCPNSEAGGPGARPIFGSSAGNTYHFAFGAQGGASGLFDGNRMSVNAYPGSPSGFYTNLDQYPVRIMMRDCSAWQHWVIRWDTTQSTSTNRIKMWCNGEEFAPWTWTIAWPAQNSIPPWSETTNRTLYIGYVNYFNSVANYFDGYMAEFHNIDGQALSPTDFGETDSITGQWIPKKYTGSYGNYGFYLKFDPSAANGIGHDHSGNGNHWTPNNFNTSGNITANDVSNDSPTNNHCIINYSPFNDQNTPNRWDAGLYIECPNNGCFVGTHAATHKSYFEFHVNSLANISEGVGWFASDIYDRSSVAFIRSYSDIVLNGTDLGNFTAATNGTVLGFTYDPDTRQAKIYRNNTLEETRTLSAGYTYLPGIASGGGQTNSGTFNFGQVDFVYTPPSGFKAMCANSIDTPSIKKSTDYCNAVTYTGNGSNNHAITGVGHQPDFVWIKSRTVNGHDHVLTDSVRGTSAVWRTNVQNAEYTQTDAITSFNSDGFTLGDDNSVGQAGNFNTSGYERMALCWKEGSIPGLDIVTWSGNGTSNRSISHSLGVVPDSLWVKQRNGTSNTWVNHIGLGAARTQLIFLNDIGSAYNPGNSPWGNGGHTTSTFMVNHTGDSESTNQSGETYVGYLFASVEGFSRMGTYIGNGDNNGVHVWCGFRPAIVIVKRTDGNNTWTMWDRARGFHDTTDLNNIFNEKYYSLIPNTSNQEQGNEACDFYANGFCLKRTPSYYNGNGNSYIFWAWAESPFKYSTAR